MGTRSLTVFHDEDNEEICVMYRQMDGYPEGHGKELAEFLKDMYMVNGIFCAETRKIANGMSCLTAQVIAEFKDEVGSIYIYPANTRNAGEQYIYHVNGKEGEQPIIDAFSSGGRRGIPARLFKGTGEKYLEWLENRKDED